MKEIYYLRRIADKTLDLRLEAFGAVQIAGPKWCGKTTALSFKIALHSQRLCYFIVGRCPDGQNYIFDY